MIDVIHLWSFLTQKFWDIDLANKDDLCPLTGTFKDKIVRFTTEFDIKINRLEFLNQK